MRKVEIELPFSGFYESIHDMNIDKAIESGFNYDYETGEEKELTKEIYNAIYDADVNLEGIREEYAKHYVEAFGEKFELTDVFVDPVFHGEKGGE